MRNHFKSLSNSVDFKGQTLTAPCRNRTNNLLQIDRILPVEKVDVPLCRTVEKSASQYPQRSLFLLEPATKLQPGRFGAEIRFPAPLSVAGCLRFLGDFANRGAA